MPASRNPQRCDLCGNGVAELVAVHLPVPAFRPFRTKRRLVCATCRREVQLLSQRRCASCGKLSGSLTVVTIRNPDGSIVDEPRCVDCRGGDHWIHSSIRQMSTPEWCPTCADLRAKRDAAA